MIARPWYERTLAWISIGRNYHSTWSLYDGDGNYVAKVIDHSTRIAKFLEIGVEPPDRYIWFFVDDPMDLPVPGGFESLDAAQADCMEYVNRGVFTLTDSSDGKPPAREEFVFVTEIKS